MSNKVIIFGATGNTGSCCLKAAVDLGFDTTAFVRNPSLLPPDLAEKITVIKGDVTDKTLVESALKGNQLVVIALGTRNDLAPTTVLSEGTRNVIDGMKKSGIKKLSACISSFLFWERAKVPERFHPLTEDHDRMLSALKESDLDWVAVMPPHIADEAGKGNYIVEAGTKAPGRTISKYDLGHFLVTCLNKEEYYGKCCGICDKPQA